MPAFPTGSSDPIKIGDLVILGTREGWEQNPVGIVVSIVPVQSRKGGRATIFEYEVFLISKRGKSIKLYFSEKDLMILSRAKINKNEEKGLHKQESFDKILEEINKKRSDLDKED